MSRFIIAGLGNYTHPNTRHSVGQVVLESLAGKWNVSLKRDRKHLAWLGTKSIDIQGSSLVEVTLVKPELLMNVSGPAVTSVLQTYPREYRSPRNVILLQDSLSHSPLVVSPKFAGSANGHNGVRSVIASMGNMASQFPTPRPGNDEFHRIRLGIGRPAHTSADVAAYVLGPLSREELDWWAYGGEGLNKVVTALENILRKGVQ